MIKLYSNDKRCWAEIDFDAVKHNFNVIKSKLSDDKKLCCVVKADAYGHGAKKLSKIYENMGADYFAVSNINEAIELRKSGISKPVMILGFTNPECADLLDKYNIEQAVFSKEYGERLNFFAEKFNVRIKIHIKLDSGMGRIGFKTNVSKDLDDAKNVCVMNNLIPIGVFTHFAVADEGEDGKNYTHNQYKSFNDGIKHLEALGVKFEIKHCSNSASIMNYSDFEPNMVRAGIILYGLNPSEKVDCSEFKSVMSVKTVISQIKEISSGECLSYGCTYKAAEKRKIATIPMGYADGLLRYNSNNGYVLIRGQKAPIVGRVCMDQAMVDVTDIGNININDIVTIFGESNSEFISADDVAKRCKTIGYEIVCDISKRVPRIYFENGKEQDEN